MIPDLAVIIAAYCVARLIGMCFRNTKEAQVFVNTMAIIAMIIIVLVTIDISSIAGHVSTSTPSIP
jgi:hypothetical protein